MMNEKNTEPTNAPELIQEFDSSNIAKAEYDPFMKVMTLHFRKGGIYEYIEVNRNVFDGLVEAESAGRYFHSNVKGKFDFLKRS